uniref:Uncharacterized protein n=1 Tax=Babesia bovis TaxID=5865 RepID=A7ANJ5_BABBO|eukprot:XP_001611697.1 hypothetical protein [Babesia bovis T2Bo]
MESSKCPVNDYIGEINAITSKITAEKCYKRLVMYGSKLHLPRGELLPGSKVLLSELLLVNFVSQSDNGNTGERLLPRLMEECIHPLAKEICGANSIDKICGTLTDTTTRQQRKRPESKTSDAPNDTPIENQPKKLRTSVDNVSAEGDLGLNTTTMSGGSDVADSVHDKEKSGGEKHFSHSFSDIIKSPEHLLSVIAQSTATLRPWELYGNYTGRSKSEIWVSRMSTVFTIIAGLEGISDATHCSDCDKLINKLYTSFHWNLRCILCMMKRYEDVEALQGNLFQNIIAAYYNGDGLVSTFYSYLEKGIGYTNAISDCINRNTEVMAKVVASWISDERIHCFVDPIVYMSVHQLLFNAILKLGTANELQPMGQERLEVFRDAVVSFIMGSVAEFLDYMCNANNLSCDEHCTMDVHYAYHFNARLQRLEYMVDNYVNTISSVMNTTDEIAIHILPAILSPFLGDNKIYRWIAGLDFKNVVDEQQRRHCRLAIVIMYIIILNHQHPSIRSEEVRFMRKFHSLPWASAIRFCCEDPVMFYMVGPMICALVQYAGEGILINMSTDESIDTIVDRTLHYQLQECKEAEGPNALSHELIKSVSSKSPSFVIDIIRKKIISTLLNHNVEVESMPLSSWRYYAVANLSPLLCQSDEYIQGVAINDLTPQNKGIWDRGKHTNASQWVLYYLNVLYSKECTLFDTALLDTIIYNYILKEAECTEIFKDAHLMPLTDDSGDDVLQAYISTNHIALQQNPINLLLRMPSMSVMAFFLLRAFCNIMLQLFYSLYKYVCYGFPMSGMNFKTTLGVMDINALQESAALNLVIEMLHENISGTLEANVASFISLMTSKPTFNKAVIVSSGLPMKSVIRWVDPGVTEDKMLEKTAEIFVKSVESLLNEIKKDNSISHLDAITICKQDNTQKLCLEPHGADKVAIYHLYNVLLKIVDIPELSMEPKDMEQDINAKNILNVVTTVWSCLKVGGENALVMAFIKDSISITLQIHYLCPWMIKISIDVDIFGRWQKF